MRSRAARSAARFSFDSRRSHVFLWFVSFSVLGVYFVFRDPAIDYRLIALGAILPDVVDAVLRQGVGPMHSVVVAVGVLAIVMGATVGRRTLRRRLLAIPIGVFAHLALDGAWASTRVFWWPLAGNVARHRLPSLDRGPTVAVALEVAGTAGLFYVYRRFRLHLPANRARFWSSGRLGTR
jgi:hypothetical protein